MYSILLPKILVLTSQNLNFHIKLIKFNFDLIGVSFLYLFVNVMSFKQVILWRFFKEPYLPHTSYGT